MKYTLDEQQCQNIEVSSRREWLLANGIGGFSMGTASGINTRRYHGLLVAATRPPTGRWLLLAEVEAFAQSGANQLPLSTNQYPGALHPHGYQFLRRFETDGVSASWHFRNSSVDITKTVRMVRGENTVEVLYRNNGKKPTQLILRPLVCHRDFHHNFSERGSYPNALELSAQATTLEDAGIRLTLHHPSAQRQPVHGWYYRFEHARELERGLDPRDDLYCPCELRFDLAPGEVATLVATSEDVPGAYVATESKPIEPARLTPLLEQAAEPFLIETTRRASILAGYPWFTDWGRDTMISIPGLCIKTGRTDLAKRILTDFSSQMSQGLIPNRFVEKAERADYNTVDATLWFANAVYKTLEADWDEDFARRMFASLRAVYEWHSRGTMYGIRVDPVDGLLTQGGSGLQLTWMDAKIGDWVVTPRHGKPIEINGLWINALRVIEWIAEKLGEDTSDFATAAQKAEANFESKFWHEKRGHYLDTADPADASLRPNQLIALALPFVNHVNGDHARRAVDVATRELLTPNGLRTLGPKEPGYRGRFRGPLAELDSAYHQGTVWPWLFGPYITAYMRFVGDRKEAKRVLKHARSMLTEYGLGGIAECYDGDEPQAPAGCPWQAWSAAEILRAWTEDIGGD